MTDTTTESSERIVRREKREIGDSAMNARSDVIDGSSDMLEQTADVVELRHPVADDMATRQPISQRI
jgi:hypothetical protein